MKIYVEMDELQFEKYKEALNKPIALTDYPSSELAASLLHVINKEGGKVDTSDSYMNGYFNKTSVAKIAKANFVITLVVEKRGDR